jgi:hypothetical protein
LQQIESLTSVQVDEFMKRYSSLKQEMVMEVIRFLLDSKMVQLNKEGALELSKK